MGFGRMAPRTSRSRVPWMSGSTGGIFPLDGEGTNRLAGVGWTRIFAEAWMTPAGVLSMVLVLATPQPQSPSPQGQPPPPTGLIVGRVVDAGSGRPVPGAIVTIDGAGLSRAGTPYRQPRAMTNASGQFVFRKLGRGSYGV